MILFWIYWVRKTLLKLKFFFVSLVCFFFFNAATRNNCNWIYTHRSHCYSIERYSNKNELRRTRVCVRPRIGTPRLIMYFPLDLCLHSEDRKLENSVSQIMYKQLTNTGGEINLVCDQCVVCGCYNER